MKREYITLYIRVGDVPRTTLSRKAAVTVGTADFLRWYLVVLVVLKFKTGARFRLIRRLRRLPEAS